MPSLIYHCRLLTAESSTALNKEWRQPGHDDCNTLKVCVRKWLTVYKILGLEIISTLSWKIYFKYE